MESRHIQAIGATACVILRIGRIRCLYNAEGGTETRWRLKA